MKTSYLKKITVFILAMATQLGISTYASMKNTEKLSQDLESFSSIELIGTTVIELEQTGRNTITIEGPAQVIERFQKDVKNNKLVLQSPDPSNEYKVLVTFSELASIKLTGASRLTGREIITAGSLKVEAEGASYVRLTVAAEELQSKLSGAASMVIDGEAGFHNTEILGASHLSAFNLETQNTQIRLAGAGKAQVHATKNLKGSISGLGNIYYVESPAEINVETTGLGSLRKASETEIKKAVADTTRISIRGSEVLILTDKDQQKQKRAQRKRHFSGNWGGVEIGVNGFLDKDHNLSLPTAYEFMELDYRRSIAVNLNLIEESFNLYKNRVGLVTGLGFSFNNYQFAHDINFLPAHNEVVGIEDTIKSLKKNKLKMTYLTLPVLLEAQPGRSSRFHISGGMVFGLRIGSHTRQVYEIDGARYRDRVYDDFNLNPFRADLNVRIGWGSVNLYASYALLPMFKSSKDPEIYPVSVGLRLLGW